MAGGVLLRADGMAVAAASGVVPSSIPGAGAFPRWSYEIPERFRGDYGDVCYGNPRDHWDRFALFKTQVQTDDMVFTAERVRIVSPDTIEVFIRDFGRETVRRYTLDQSGSRLTVIEFDLSGDFPPSSETLVHCPEPAESLGASTNA